MLPDRDLDLCAACDDSGHVPLAARIGAALDRVLSEPIRARSCSVAPGSIVDDELLPSPIVGLTFLADFDATQEYGLQRVIEAITGTDRRRYQMTAAARAHMAICTDQPAFALSVQQLPATFAWGDCLPGAPVEYATRWQSARPWVRGEDRIDPRLPVTRLRELAQARGVQALPRRKDELIEAILAAPGDALVERPDVWPANFDFGTTLVVRADSGVTNTIVDALRDAIAAGTFAVGSAPGLFHTGVLLYDARDETVAFRTCREAAHDWHDARMAELEPVMAALTAAGWRSHFAGNPRPGGWETDDGREDGTVRYWINGQASSKTNGRQPYGWYTLEELRAEKFAADALARD